MSEQIVSDRPGRHHADSMESPRPVWSLLAEHGHYPTRLTSHAAPELEFTRQDLRHWVERIDAVVAAHVRREGLRRFAVVDWPEPQWRPAATRLEVAGFLPVTEFSVPEVTR